MEANLTSPTPGGKNVTDVDVVVVGAGFGGMYALHRMRELGLSVAGFEAGDDVGGTWFWNRYPGARCDVESVDYSYSFSAELEQEWVWTERYPAQPEILRYLNHVADRFDLRRDFRFGTRVMAAHYDEQDRRWAVSTDSGQHVSAALCIFAIGNLSTLYVPDLPGLDAFEGRILHTARWPADGVEFADRRVGVIGTGSTGIQAIPAIARGAGHVTVFQRTPNYSIPAVNRPLTSAQLAAIRADYPARRELNRRSRSGIHVDRGSQSALTASPAERADEYARRWAMGGGANFLAAFADLYTDLDANETAAEFVRGQIRQTVRDPDLAERLTPKGYPIGSKRICVDIDYFETFNRDNVSLVDIRESPIRSVTAHGICTEDGEYRLDDLVFATGFDAITGPLFAIDICGEQGRALSESWADAPHTYLGLMTTGFPNLFLVTGPGSPSVLSNVVVSIEHHVELIVGILESMKARGYGTVQPTAEAEADWTDHVDALAQQTLYPRANSWYMGANIPGKPRRFTLYAGGVDAYQAECERIVAAGYPGFTFEP
ncbi:NAD(P)/FAD-dependent oxidoreductase [Jatrophihabitans cynanchi]|uniref:NAD(P)/FAD-dependent oxidoreductase n=1 Tax=Jatrophihabitans cynanchi TaxID=2944128 RepID=A0ABY7K0H3_9ACTN|nr:NAD(P)/FAD-dependent oxidoreductase [Jatrophihabitans sp. SB3-54]WAX58358.1 NAD(P)/FAD-dependent oxidoreductase [Jatrophihabitans sp. SB3-54]